MPGSIANAVAVTVMPLSLCKMFRSIREWPVLENSYKGGESQRGSMIPLSSSTGTTRLAWEQGKRINATKLELLRAFWEARKGSQEAFYFYDPFETSPLFSHDPTGVATSGRYTVRFDGEWSQTVVFPRIECSIRLVQVS